MFVLSVSETPNGEYQTFLYTSKEFLGRYRDIAILTRTKFIANYPMSDFNNADDLWRKFQCYIDTIEPGASLTEEELAQVVVDVCPGCKPLPTTQERYL